MDHEEILKRDDGSKVKLSIHFRSDWYRSYFEYKVNVEICKPKKRTWEVVVDLDDWHYRRLTMPEREQLKENEYLKYVTPQEILAAKLKCWEKLKPV